ncbi:MAG: SulP family inorganic anion transporter, partial [Nitrospirales bacterium]
AGLFGGLTTATATMRSFASIACGAKSILAPITMGAVLLSLVLGLAPLATYIPMPALAAVLYRVGWDILDWRVFPVLRRLSKTDKICFWVTFLVTMSIDLLVAVAVGLSIAFFRFVKEMSDLGAPKVVSLQDPREPLPGRELIDSSIWDRIGIIQPEGPLFFGVADAVYRTSRFFIKYDVVILSLSRVPTIDVSGAFMLEDLIQLARKSDTHVLITELTPTVRSELEKLEILQKVGSENCFDQFDLAVDRARGLISARAQRPLAGVSAGVEAPS